MRLLFGGEGHYLGSMLIGLLKMSKVVHFFFGKCYIYK